MGRRARRRNTKTVAAAGRDSRASRAPASAEKKVKPKLKTPPAPWGSFPLSELVILIALVIGAIGLLLGGRQGLTMVLVAAGLGSLAGLELAIREHLAGYRSHTTLLAALAAAAVMTALILLVPGTGVLLYVVRIALTLAVFAFVFYRLRQLFKKRSGGASFR